jgi:N-acetylmuramoyl-L-alanine amidase
MQAVVDGQVLSKKLKVYEYRGDLYFSLRELAKIYNAGTAWHPIAGNVSLLMNNKKTEFYIKSTKIVIDGKTRRERLPNHLLGNEVYVPTDFVTSSEFAAFTETDTSWNPDTKILTVESKLNLNPPRFYSDSDFTKIAFEMSEKLPYSVNDKKPGYIEVSFLRARTNSENIEVNDGVVKKIVVKTKGRKAVATIYLTEGAGKMSEDFINDTTTLELTVRRTPLAQMLTASTTDYKIRLSTQVISCPLILSGLEDSQKTSTDTLQVIFSTPGAANQVLRKKILLVLDAGHGGDDPGAIGTNNTKEKDINLSIIKELKKLFETDPAKEFDVVLTRSDNTFIPLAERSRIANDSKADLFVSVHCNASMDKKTKGFEIYFLSENASDEEATATAILENSVVRLEKNQSKAQQKRDELLVSLAKNEFINESSELCCFISQDVTKRTKIENRGVKQAGFFVLRGAGMPAVLCECAYLSNIEEEAQLRNPRYQHQVADAIFNGVKKFVHRRTDLYSKRESR